MRDDADDYAKGGHIICEWARRYFTISHGHTGLLLENCRGLLITCCSPLLPAPHAVEVFEYSLRLLGVSFLPQKLVFSAPGKFLPFPLLTVITHHSD